MDRETLLLLAAEMEERVLNLDTLCSATAMGTFDQGRAQEADKWALRLRLYARRAELKNERTPTEHEIATKRGAFGAYRAVLSFISSGTPLEGVRHLVKRNVQELEKQLSVVDREGQSGKNGTRQE